MRLTQAQRQEVAQHMIMRRRLGLRRTPGRDLHATDGAGALWLMSWHQREHRALAMIKRSQERRTA